MLVRRKIRYLGHEASRLVQPRQRALGFGMGPLFADERFDAPPAGAFLTPGRVGKIDAEAIWSVLN